MIKFWTMQVKMEEQGVWFWKDVRPTGKEPYRYDTKQEANLNLNMCYPVSDVDQTLVRVKEHTV